ncbi:MAG: MCE family protein [Propionibacteriales bacterium]|nr:MCE family protein [Propionibacteriales bacterium]
MSRVTNTRTLRLAGAGLVLVVVAAFGLTGALYVRAFSNPAEITLQTSRAGLVMDPGGKVKLRGVEIGRIGEVRTVGDGVEIVLEIDRDELDGIPADVVAEIRATTIFGAKYVELVAPSKTGAAPVGSLADGAVIKASGVTTEINTVFDGLDRVLSGIDIASLNGTLTVLATTLSGRGDDIAALASEADAYLTKLEPLLPQLRRDLAEVARFARLAVEVSPALIAILRNATVTAGTIADEEQALDRLLVDLSLLGGRATELLGDNGDALARLLDSARPTAATLRAYSSELPCFLQGLDETRKIMADVIGGTDATLRALVSVRSELSHYTVPKDLPGLPEDRGPDCHGLPRLKDSQVPIPERGTAQ